MAIYATRINDSRPLWILQNPRKKRRQMRTSRLYLLVVGLQIIVVLCSALLFHYSSFAADLIGIASLSSQDTVDSTSRGMQIVSRIAVAYALAHFLVVALSRLARLASDGRDRLLHSLAALMLVGAGICFVMAAMDADRTLEVIRFSSTTVAGSSIEQAAHAQSQQVRLAYLLVIGSNVIVLLRLLLALQRPARLSAPSKINNVVFASRAIGVVGWIVFAGCMLWLSKKEESLAESFSMVAYDTSQAALAFGVRTLLKAYYLAASAICTIGGAGLIAALFGPVGASCKGKVS